MQQINSVLVGKYKNAKIHGYKEISVQIPGYIGRRSINKSNISFCTVIDETNKSQYSIWKDGEKSWICIDN